MGLDIAPDLLVPESAHFSLPMCFETSERLDLDALVEGRIATIPMPWRFKDYDAVAGASMAATLREFDTSRWVLLAALDEGTRVGGAIVAFDTPKMDLLEGRADMTTLLDIRVAPAARGGGVGRRLFAAVEDWSRSVGARLLTIETQDINVGACRFYHAMGCTVRTIRKNAYPGLDEHQIIWERAL
jgi:GNAT superfamily N-acetyltransferase